MGWWLLVTGVLGGLMWAWQGFDRGLLAADLVVAGLVLGSLMAGVIALRKGRRVAGVMGLLGPLMPIVFHFAAALIPALRVEGWAPTYVADLAGIGVSVLFLLVALAGAVLGSRRTSPTIGPDGSPR